MVDETSRLLYHCALDRSGIGPPSAVIACSEPTPAACPALPGGPADSAAPAPADTAPATVCAAPSGATGCAPGASTAVDTPSSATGRTPRWAAFRGRGEGRVILAAAVAGAALA